MYPLAVKNLKIKTFPSVLSLLCCEYFRTGNVEGQKNGVIIAKLASEIALKKHYIILLSMAANVIISSNSIASTQLYAGFFVRGLFILK